MTWDLFCDSVGQLFRRNVGPSEKNSIKVVVQEPDLSGENVPAHFHELEKCFSDLVAPLINTLQDYLRKMEGKSFEGKSLDEFREFTRSLHLLVKRLDLCFEIPEGKFKGLPCNFTASLTGLDQRPRFAFKFFDGQKWNTKSQGTTVPKLTLKRNLGFRKNS